MDLCFVVMKLTLKPLLATMYRHSENLVKDNQMFCPCDFFDYDRFGTMVLGCFSFLLFPINRYPSHTLLIMCNSIQLRLKYDKKEQILLIILFRFNVISITKLISRF